MTLYELMTKVFEYNPQPLHSRYKKIFTEECKKLLEKGVTISNEDMAKLLSKKTGANWFYRCEKQGSFSEKSRLPNFQLYAGFINPSSFDGKVIKNKYDIAFSKIAKFDEEKEFFFDNMLHSLNWFEIYVESFGNPKRPHAGQFLHSVVKEIPCNPIHEAEIQYCNRYTDSERIMQEVVIYVNPVVEKTIMDWMDSIELSQEAEDKIANIAENGRGGK